jgi:DNA-binding beta-propeller fold protein YncE
MQPTASTRRPFPRGVLTAATSLVFAILMAGCGPTDSLAGQSRGLEVDPHWPAQLPNNWILGQVAGVAVDDRDHVWIVHRPRSVNPVMAGAAQDPPISACCVPAPPVIEFDPEGNVVQAWGGPGEGYEWSDEEHGIHVDHLGNVWVGGGLGGNHVLKFTRDGRFLLQIGEKENLGGSNHTDLLGGPAAMEVDPETNELFIADGYRNRRVAVFDAETGEYLRHWGAYGNVPADGTNPERNYTRGPDAQFRGPVHGIALSRDGLVYVTDRQANRVQIFRKSGEFVDEFFIRPETLSMGSTWDLALSTDPDQGWIYVPDGTNHVLWVVDRQSLEVVQRVGHGGRMAGQFDWVHNVAVDSRGNVFTAEVSDGHRVQRFVPRGR